MTQHLDVFVSSTSDDLRAHRAAVREAILDLGLHPIMMENFPSADQTAVNKCKQAVERAEIYVGIFAHRYGWVPTPKQGGDDERSITAWEYFWAGERDIPRLCFLVDPAHPWKPEWIEDEPGKARLAAFKQHVSGETIRSEFTTPEHLAQEVLAALHHAVQELTGEAPTVGGWRRPTAPYPLHNFVGRADDRAALSDLLTAEGEPVVAVRGTGGIGKTFLAQQLARDLAAEFPGGVLWTTFGPDARNAESVVARVLYDWVRYHPQGRNLEAPQITPALARNLLADAPGRLLVIIDDVWHPRPVRALREALPPNTACLLTTRKSNIAALGGHNYRLSKLDPADGVALITDRVCVAGADPADHADSLREIVDLLDGHALALDLAARQLIERGIDFAPRFIERLQRHLGGETPFKLLELGQGEVREDSLEAALYLSYEPLSAALQGRFRALGVLAPEATYSAATIIAVWAAGEELDDDAREEFEDALAELVSAGLVARDEITHRYDQHMTLHTYAAALARREGEQDTNLKHYTLHVIDDLAMQFHTLPQEEWNAMIGPDLPQIHYMGDLIAGYVQAIVLGPVPVDDLAKPEPPDDLSMVDVDNRMAQALLERGEDFAYAITGYVFRRYVAEEGRRWLRTGLACARLRGSQSRERLFLGQLAIWHDHRGQKQDALAYNHASLEICRVLEDKNNEATTLNNIGKVYSDLGRKQEALGYCEQALVIYREVGDRGGEATTLNNIGKVYSDLGRKQEALGYYEQALPMYREVGERAGEAATLHNFAVEYWALGEMQKSLEYYEQALPIRREVGDRRGEAVTLSAIGLVYSALGQKQKALECYEQALPIRREVGDRGGEARTLTNIGLVYQSAGNNEEALEYYEQALPILREVGSRGAEATTLNNIGGVYRIRGQSQEALEYYEQALVIYREVGDKYYEAITCFNVGVLLHEALGRTAAAVEYMERAVQLAEETSNPNLGDFRAQLEQLRALL